MSSNTLTFRAPIRGRSLVMRIPAERRVEQLPEPSEAPARRSALHAVADQASPSVRGDFRVFALGNR